jgi:membrane-bound lytic murein transglycosylase F
MDNPLKNTAWRLKRRGRSRIPVLGRWLTRGDVAAALVLAILLAGGIWFMGQTLSRWHMGDRIRVAAPRQEMVLAAMTPYGLGLDFDLVMAFCRSRGLDPEWLVFDDWANGIEMLSRGQADVLVGGGGRLHGQGLSFAVRSPGYAMNNIEVVRHRHGPPEPPIPENCRAPELVSALALLPAAYAPPTPDACANPPRQKNVTSLSVLLQDLARDTFMYCLAPAGHFDMLQPFYPDIRPETKLNLTSSRHWYWRPDSHLDGEFTDFWSRDHRDVLPGITELYLGFFPDQTDYYDLTVLRETMVERMPRFDEHIVEAGRINGIDPLFLAAVIYQESLFRPRARSITGVRGLMQLSLPTASQMGIENRLDPVQSIHGGAKYLRWLHDQVEFHDFSPWQRWFMALAAYNQGLGHLNDAVKLTRQQGLNPDSWADVKKSYRLLTQKKYYTQARHGYVRGFEAVDYVASVRYYYYVLSGLSILPGREAKHLSGLRAVRPDPWP